MKWKPLALAPWLTAIGLGAWIIGITGCSTFNRDWIAAGPGSSRPNHLRGRWEGEWRSAVNRHHGNLRCVLTDLGDGKCRARFRAKFATVFTVHYAILLEARPVNAGWELSGRANLGWWRGGVYRYEGRVTATNFFSTYACRYDQGTFELRPME
ncbi:MAG: hypothetical protein KGS61_09460 [Verrucomicrobia bacterium]|nr:hypothetical protein [Verrucomicrobiota bacterium]